MAGGFRDAQAWHTGDHVGLLACLTAHVRASRARSAQPACASPARTALRAPSGDLRKRVTTRSNLFPSFHIVRSRRKHSLLVKKAFRDGVPYVVGVSRIVSTSYPQGERSEVRNVLLSFFQAFRRLSRRCLACAFPTRARASPRAATLALLCRALVGAARGGRSPPDRPSSMATRLKSDK